MKYSTDVYEISFRLLESGENMFMSTIFLKYHCRFMTGVKDEC
jgi:hypothetical protein